MVNENIKDIYLRLAGYLQQAPSTGITQPEMWEQVNRDIDELNKISGTQKYNIFKIIPESRRITLRAAPYPYVDSTLYKSKLQGIVNQLSGEVYPNE